MRKTIAVVFVCILLCPLMTCLAVPKADVYIEDTGAKSGSVLFVPVYIKNNPGLMGFRITVRYDAEVLSPRAASRGTVTESGMFEDNVGSSEDASVDVLWNNTTEIKKDGTLAILGFDCSAKATKQTILEISFSQEDTFNEKYENIVFDCKSATIDFSGETQASTRKDKRDVTDEDIVLAVETVQGDPQIPPTHAVMESVNALLSQLTGDADPYFNSPDEISESYKEAVKETFVQDVLDSVEVSRVQEIVQSALARTGAASIETIPEEMQIDFINSVESALREEAPDLKELSDFISREDEISAISQLLEDANKESEENTLALEAISDSASRKTTIWIICILGGIIGTFLTVFIVLKKLQKKSIKKDKLEEER